MDDSGHYGLRGRQTLRIDGQSIAYSVAGTGPAVVMVHGLSASSRWWDRNVPALVDRYRVYTVDLPGFGENRTPGFVRLDVLAEWLARWMDLAGIERAHLIGHSMGGFVAINLAATQPKLVDRLVLVDPVVQPFKRPWTEPITSLLAEASVVPHAFLPTLVRDFVRAGMLTVNRAAWAVIRADARPMLPSIQAPTLLIWGEKDRLLPAEQAESVAAAIPDCQVQLIQGSGHSPMWEQAEEFNRLVVAFLDESRR